MSSATHPDMRPRFAQLSPRQVAMIVVLLVVALLALALSANGAMACPDCPASRSARANVLAGSFWTNLGLVSLPLVVLTGICALLYRVGASRIEGNPSP